MTGLSRSRKVGRVQIEDSLIEDHPDVVMAIMGRMIVIRAEHLFAQDCVEYVALCDDFSTVPQGGAIPLYTATLRKDEEGAVQFEGWR